MQDTKVGGLMARNAAVQLLGRVLYLLTRVALPPITLHFVGLAEYGIWSACFILVSYLGMSTFGVSNVYIHYVADYRAKGRMEDIGRLISTGLTFTLAVTALVLPAVWLAMPWLLALFGVPEALQGTAALLLFGTAAVMMADLSVGAFAYVLHGLQLLRVQTMIWIASFLLETVLAVVLLVQGWGILALLIAFALRYVFAILVQALVCLRALPGVRIRPGSVSREHMGLFLRFGGVMQVSGILATALYSLEKLVAGRLLGVSAVGLLDLAQKLPVMASQVFSSINAAALPAMSHLHAVGQHQEAAALYVRASRYNALLVGLPLGFLAPFAGPVMCAWIGEQHGTGDAPLLLAVAAVGFHLHTLTGPASALHQGAGRPQRQFVYLGVQIALAALALWWVWLAFGWSVVGVALAVGGARVLSSLVYGIYTDRLAAVPFGTYLRAVVLPGLIPYTVGFALSLIATDWLTPWYADRLALLGGLLLAGVVYGLATLAACLPLLDREERAFLIRRLPRGPRRAKP